ncbi:hypothetical protein C9374_004451 [Naegleria lovaniensis]|uniref:F-box domain-containing protein n=1 Tax=Naegleria lovaniensis TaxID=51637 RepID=A0AA88GLF2_NAELO|nr:uncharacterized protein C9374_004451 [Naegleria lovaniensis]KAG2383114.1 hypothetical protein C9374_004451 [Naegleria lovaniensis]
MFEFTLDSLVLSTIADFLSLRDLPNFVLVCSDWHLIITNELESGEIWNRKYVHYYWEKINFYKKFDEEYPNEDASSRLKYVEKNQMILLKKLKIHQKNFSQSQLKQVVISEWCQFYNRFLKVYRYKLASSGFFEIICSSVTTSIHNLSHDEEKRNVFKYFAHKFLHHSRHLPEVIQGLITSKSHRILQPMMEHEKNAREFLSYFCDKYRPRFDYISACRYLSIIVPQLQNDDNNSTNQFKYVMESLKLKTSNDVTSLFVNNVVFLANRTRLLEMFVETVERCHEGKSIKDILSQNDVERIYSVLVTLYSRVFIQSFFRTLKIPIPKQTLSSNVVQ